MPICLDVFLAADRYDAADGHDPRAVEWPPHPGRVVSALRAVADEADLPFLRSLEQLPPPIVHASPQVTETRSRAYVVTNSLESRGKHLNHPGRTNGLRERRSIFPLVPRVQFVWLDDTAIGHDAVHRLDDLARRVPYLGRSTSLVLMSARRIDKIERPGGLEEYVPVPDQVGGLRLRVPYPGYVDELNALHAVGLSAWQASEGARASHPYRRQDGSDVDAVNASAFRSLYRDLVVLRFQDRRPAGRLTPVFTAALRSAVMRNTAAPLPPALHGHGYDGNPHVAYLGLPVCGHQHADGHLVGLAVAIPGMDEDERRRILRGVIGSDPNGIVSLEVPGFREPFQLRYDPDEPLPRSSTSAHWVGTSRQWVTATPIVLDRYPKNENLAEAVSQSIVMAGLPEPALVEASTSSLTTGAVTLKPRELPKRAVGRLYCHARVLFDQAIAGPVLAGAGRYFGVGLFLPEKYDGGLHDAI